MLISVSGSILVRNRIAARSIPEARPESELVQHVDDPQSLRRYLSLASRSSSPVPGAITFTSSGKKWRADGSALVHQGQHYLVLHLRPFGHALESFVALNEQISKLNAEIRRRMLVEQELESSAERERESRARAEEASRFKDELLATTSHELRTPLHAISGWLSILRDNPHDTQMVKRGLEVCERNLRVQTQLVEDLVDASLIITGRMKLELQSVDLDQVVRQAADTMRPAIEAKRQRLEIIAEPGACVIHGDSDRLVQVVWNLLSNASKHTPKEGKIQVTVRCIESHAELTVSDTGEGIAPEVLPYVFDRFRRADSSTTRRSGGLGLGLSIVRGLVELHGGVVMVDSDGLGRGSSFTVSLPLPIFRRESAAEETDAAAACGGTHRVLEGLEVLLVEDHDDSRELLAHILSARGATITAVPDASAARDAFQDRAYDIILSDIEMPEEDGFTLIRKLRDLERSLGRKRVPAIAVTAHKIRNARVHALRAGYQAFLAKPVAPDELVAMVRSLCGG